jgi:ABC-2 type transport system permease protein
MSDSPIVAAIVTEESVALSRRVNLRGLWTLFVLTVRQHVRGKRLLVLSLLFAIPALLAVAVNYASRVAPPAEGLEFALIFNLIPHALVPLAALLYSAGIIQDEVEEQTLTYLLVRPLPRWAIYLVKLLATMLVTSLLTVVFTCLTFSAIALSAQTPAQAAILTPALKTAGLLALTQVAYCGLFGFLGLLLRRSLLTGIAYVILFEGLLARLDTVARRMTVMYYFRVLVLRWLAPTSGPDWSIDLTTAPTIGICVVVLLGVGAVMALLSAVVFASKEFRMKTGDGQ